MKGSTVSFLLYVATLLILPSGAASGESIEGTDKRLEIEYKLSYTGLKTAREEFAQDVNQEIAKLAKTEGWLFSEDYRLDKEPNTFVFRDVYIDNDNLELANNSISYRLRHRWKSVESFKKHLRAPQKKKYFPIRCEIQLKTNYRKSENGMFLADETRFEFRNESAPFKFKRDAPKAPWPLKEYLQYATAGKFREYRILPFDNLQKTKVSTQGLQPSFVLLTERTRSHLHTKNQWGSGPNPDQVFIITLDYSRIQAVGKNLASKTKNEKWKDLAAIEFELEIDRSVMTKILQGLPDEKASTAKRKLEADLTRLKNNIEKYISKKYSLKPGNSKSKYRRFTDLMRSS